MKTAQMTGREGRSGIGRMIDIFRDPRWVAPVPIFSFLIEHPEGRFLRNFAHTRPTLFYAAEVPQEADQIAAVPRTGNVRQERPHAVPRYSGSHKVPRHRHRTLRGPAQGPYLRAFNSGRRPDSR